MVDGGLRRARRRRFVNLSVGITSQGVTSLTNVLLVVACARSATAEQLGIWSMGYSFVVLTTTVVRASINTAFVLRLGRLGADGKSSARALSALGISLALSFFGSGVLAVWAILDAGNRWMLVALAVANVGAVIEDGLRYLAIAVGEPGRALALDSVWLLIFIGLSILVSPANLAHQRSKPSSGAAGAWVAVLVGLLSSPRPLTERNGVRRVWRMVRSDALNLGVEAGANALSLNALPSIAALTVSTALAGELAALKPSSAR